MKDALGHGSNGRGIHGDRLASLPKGLRVEKHVASVGRTTAGQVNTKIGNVYERMGTFKRTAVAETVAKGLRIDNPNNRIRIR